MSVGEYFQEYGPVHRRRSGEGPLPDDEAVDRSPPPRRTPRTTPLRDEPATPSHTQRAAARQPAHPDEREATPERESARARLRNRRRTGRQQVARHPPFSWVRLLVGVVLLGAVALLLAPYIVQATYQGQALPGVSIQGVAVDSLQQPAIEKTVSAQYADFLRQPVTLRYEEMTWTPSLQELGATLDLEHATTSAMQLGRQGNPLERLRQQWILRNQGVDIAPRIIVDQQQVQRYLLGLHEQMNRPPRDASLGVSAHGNVFSTPGAEGLQLLVNENTDALLLALQSLTPQEVHLRTRTLPPTISDAEMEQATLQATAIVSEALVLTHGEERHVWEPADLAALVRIEPVDGSLTVGLNEERLSKRVEGLAQVVDSGSVEPRVRFENGNLFIVQPGQQGWQLLQDEAIAVISETLQHRTERTVALPVEELQPRVTPDMLASLGIHELVGEGRSSFAGSEAYRITNIKAGVAAMDGVLIAPDEEFSFNTQLGPVDGEHGFVQGYAIVNSRTALEWGGGVCQNSTTVFRAAFWAGLPITEWHPHPFYLNWYDPFGYGAYGNGPGMDATIFTGVQDFKFVNDTGNWLLLQFYVDDVNQVITVHLYGTSPEREVRFDGPYISNQRGGGAQDITVFRTIVEGGVQQEPEAFFTSFKPW